MASLARAAAQRGAGRAGSCSPAPRKLSTGTARPAARSAQSHCAGGGPECRGRRRAGRCPGPARHGRHQPPSVPPPAGGRVRRGRRGSGAHEGGSRRRRPPPPLSVGGGAAGEGRRRAELPLEEGARGGRARAVGPPRSGPAGYVGSAIRAVRDTDPKAVSAGKGKAKAALCLNCPSPRCHTAGAESKRFCERGAAPGSIIPCRENCAFCFPGVQTCR